MEEVHFRRVALVMFVVVFFFFIVQLADQLVLLKSCSCTQSPAIGYGIFLGSLVWWHPTNAGWNITCRPSSCSISCPCFLQLYGITCAFFTKERYVLYFFDLNSSMTPKKRIKPSSSLCTGEICLKFLVLVMISYSYALFCLWPCFINRFSVFIVFHGNKWLIWELMTAKKNVNLLRQGQISQFSTQTLLI